MARQRKLMSQVSNPTVESDSAEASEGIWFINNFLNREFPLANNNKFKFERTRQIFTDPEQIAVLTDLAKNPSSRIIREEPAPVEAEPEEEPPLESESPSTTEPTL